MQDELISREATLKPYKGLNDEDTISVWLIKKNIEQQPSVTPQSKTGHWIQENSVLICSICDARVARYDKYPYCPNCGAKMI